MKLLSGEMEEQENSRMFLYISWISVSLDMGAVPLM